jgi:hypothetical protein
MRQKQARHVARPNFHILRQLSCLPLIGDDTILLKFPYFLSMALSVECKRDYCGPSGAQLSLSFERATMRRIFHHPRYDAETPVLCMARHFVTDSLIATFTLDLWIMEASWLVCQKYIYKASVSSLASNPLPFIVFQL